MELRVHLKVCEGCGCLWYRGQVETRVYCAACNERLKEFPTPESRKRRGRPKKMTLPAVFAVQASAENYWEEGERSEGRVSRGAEPASPRPGKTVGAGLGVAESAASLGIWAMAPQGGSPAATGGAR